MKTIVCRKKYALPWGGSPDAFLEAFTRIKLRMENSRFIHVTCELCEDGSLEVTYEREARLIEFYEEIKIEGTTTLNHIIERLTSKKEKAARMGFDNVGAKVIYSVSTESLAGVSTILLQAKKYI